MERHCQSSAFRHGVMSAPALKGTGPVRMIDRSGPAARYLVATAFAVAAITTATSGSRAQSADFYRGKTITIVVGTGDSGPYVISSRILARHWSKYIPGNPNIIVQAMPGGGGLKMAGWLHHVAQRDGTVVGMPVQTAAMLQVLEPNNAKYDVRAWNWLGIVTEMRQAVMVSSAAPVRSMEDARKREVIIGATAATGGNLFVVPKLAKELAGAKFKIVLGYRGAADMDLAIANGELQGRGGSWNDWKQLHPDWAKRDTIVPLVLTGMTRDREAPDLPLLRELVSDPVDRQVVDFFSQTDLFARSFALPPGTPQQAVDLLRASFAEAVKDEQLRTDLTKGRWSLETRDWRQMEQAANDTLSVAPAVVARMKEVLAR
jgi:tripartite-type tricarboxylate transporter receptor subunit TctC